MGPQRAVDEALDGPDRQAVVDRPDHPVGRAALGQGPVPGAQHDVEADGEDPFLGHFLVEVDRGEGRTGIVEGRDAVDEAFPRGQLDLLAGPGPGLLGRIVARLVADEALGRFEEGADGAALGVTDDLAAGRIGRRPGDLGELHGLGVGQGGVAAGVGQEDGIVRRRPAEGVVDGQAVDAGLGDGIPLVLVPAPAEDPVAGLGLFGGLRDEGHDLVPGPGLGQIEDHLGGAEAREVAVALDKSGDGQGPAEIEDLGPFAHEALVAVLAAAQGGDAAFAGGQPGGCRDLVVHGHDLGVHEDEVDGRDGRDEAPNDEEDDRHGDDGGDEDEASVLGHAIPSLTGDGRQRRRRASSKYTAFPRLSTKKGSNLKSSNFRVTRHPMTAT